MTGQIYLLRDDSDVVALTEAPYDSEALLQQLLARHSNLLAGEQMNVAAPRKWILVSREVGVPAEQDGAQRWSLDHLFLDQDGIPTLVEVKRSSDTRIRREVVGQMLDYAANAVSYWSIDEIRERYHAECERDGVEPSKRLTVELSIDEQDLSSFWEKVKTNLQAGRIRMVFVADVIPLELRSIVEFLNRQMDPAEVLAVEIKQFVSENLRTLVPKVIGQTVTAQAKRAVRSTSSETINEEDYLEGFPADPPQRLRFARRLIEWASATSTQMTFGRSSTSSAAFVAFQIGKKTVYPALLRDNGQLVFQMRFVARHDPPFTEQKARDELQARLELIPGFDLRGGMMGLPFIDVDQLADADYPQVFSVLEWIEQKLTEGMPERDRDQ
ncbi:MAG: hypothetical protein NXI32_12110 [bacterium]|nr:hypothetical protein [bacterium]